MINQLTFLGTIVDFEYGFVNSKWSGVRNVPKKSYRYMQFCMVQMGKMFLNDNVWATYDVIIDTHTSAGGGKFSAVYYLSEQFLYMPFTDA